MFFLDASENDDICSTHAYLMVEHTFRCQENIGCSKYIRLSVLQPNTLPGTKYLLKAEQGALVFKILIKLENRM